jgi:hypothetical protein
MDIGGRLCRSDSGLKMPHDPQKRPLYSVVEPVPAVGLLLLDDGDKELGREEHQGPAKGRRCDTENGEGVLVQSDHAAHDSAIIVKLSVPIVVAQHNVWRAVGAVLIGSVKETPEVRLKVQRVEVVPTRLHAPQKSGFVAGV